MMQGSASGLSFLGMLAHADGVVQAVVAILALGSLACWAIIFEKIARLATLRKSVARVEAFARDPVSRPADADSLLSRFLGEMADEGRPGPAVEADARLRLEASLRALALREVRLHEGGLPFLATLASTAPFIGLFGTVWGIMHSFTAIAEAQDTSLASVAPGIAEALLATAIGLAAAIPAVVGYNQIRAAFARCGYRLSVAVALIAKATSSTAHPSVER